MDRAPVLRTAYHCSQGVFMAKQRAAGIQLRCTPRLSSTERLRVRQYLPRAPVTFRTTRCLRKRTPALKGKLRRMGVPVPGFSRSMGCRRRVARAILHQPDPGCSQHGRRPSLGSRSTPLSHSPLVAKFRRISRPSGRLIVLFRVRDHSGCPAIVVDLERWHATGARKPLRQIGDP